MKFKPSNNLWLNHFGFWETRKAYISLFFDFQKKILDAKIFAEQFCFLYDIDNCKNYTVEEVSKRLQNLGDEVSQSKLEELEIFSTLLKGLSIVCSSFKDDRPFIKGNGQGNLITEQQLRYYVIRVRFKILHNCDLNENWEDWLSWEKGLKHMNENDGWTDLYWGKEDEYDYFDPFLEYEEYEWIPAWVVDWEKYLKEHSEGPEED